MWVCQCHLHDIAKQFYRVSVNCVIMYVLYVHVLYLFIVLEIHQEPSGYIIKLYATTPSQILCQAADLNPEC